MMITNITVPLIGMVDTAVMGHLPSPHYIGAVAVGAMVFSFVFWGFGFLRMGTTGLIAQASGKDSSLEVAQRLGQGLVLALAISALLLLLQWPIITLGLQIIDASEQVESAAAAYFNVRIWAAPATLVSYVLLGYFLGQGRVRVPLAMTVVANITNVILDIVFVVGLGWGVIGVAAASVVGEVAAVAVGGFVLLRSPESEGLFSVLQKFRALPDWRGFFSVNSNIMVRTICLIFAFAFFTAQGAEFGEVILAANAVLLQFQNLMAYVLDGFAHAAEVLVGKAVGRGNRNQFRRAVRLTGFWSLAVALVFSGVFLLAGDAIIALLTDLATVRMAAESYLIWAIASPLISVWSFWLDGVFIGATRTRDMRNTMLISTFCLYLPAWYFSQHWGNHGLWLALMVYMAGRGITMGWIHLRHQWAQDAI